MDTVESEIRERIRREGPITFASFMEAALYAPGKGYYTTPAVRIGRAGDYFTSPHLHSMFGALIGKQVLQMWSLLDRPDAFTVVEMGAGRGYLRDDILTYVNDAAPDFLRGLKYVAIEANPHQARFRPPEAGGETGASEWVSGDALSLRAEAPSLTPSFAHSGLPQGSGSGGQALKAEGLPGGVVGCFLSNELVDAFPVHVISNEGGALQEVYVGLKGGEFVEVTGPLSTPRIAEHLEMVGASLPEGCRAEVNLRAVEWIEAVARSLERGFVITVDYGDIASRLYSKLRPAGTLMCYHAHTAHANPYVLVGRQDMTAHVDFTALIVAGKRASLELTGLTNQAFFLASLGIHEHVASLTPEKTGPKEYARARMAMHELIQPDGLGGFKVLIQHKGLESPQLDGLRFMP